MAVTLTAGRLVARREEHGALLFLRRVLETRLVGTGLLGVIAPDRAMNVMTGLQRTWDWFQTT